MSFYLIFGFSDFPSIRKIGLPENPDFGFFRNFRSPVSENPDFRESENPDFQISGLPDLRKSGFPEIRKSRFSDFRGIGCRNFWGIRCQASEVSGPIEETWWFWWLLKFQRTSWISMSASEDQSYFKHICNDSGNSSRAGFCSSLWSN